MAGENINRKLNIYINDKEVVNSLSGITREMGKTRNELKNLNKNSADYDADVARLTKHLSDLNDKQTEFKDELKLTNKEMSAARDNFTNLLGGLASGDMKAVQDGLMGIRGSLVSSAQAAWAFVATPIGAVIAGLVGFGAAAKAVFSFNEEAEKSAVLIENLSGKTGQIVEDIRIKMQSLTDTFGLTFDQLAGAVDNLVDTGVAKNELEALETIKNGLLTAPDKNEFIASLESSAVTAKQVGMSLEEVIALKKQIEETGVNPEATFGALQKASQKLAIQTDTLRKSLSSAFGASFTDEILAKVKTGQISTVQALDLIGKKSTEVGLNQTQQAELAKELFGKSALAAGGYATVIDTVTGSFKKQKEELNNNQKALLELENANENLNKSQSELFRVKNFGELWTEIKASAIDSLASILNYIVDLKKGIQPLIDIVSVVLVGAWINLKTSVVVAFDIIGGVLKVFSNSVFTIFHFVEKIFTGDFSGAINVLKDGFLNFGSIVENTFIKVKNTVVNGLKAIVDNVSPFLDAIGFDVAKIQKSLSSLKSKEVVLKSTSQSGTSGGVNTKATDAAIKEEEAKRAEAEAKKQAEASKNRAKDLEERKKHSEDLIKQENDLQKSLNDSKAKADELKSGLIKDDYERETALINTDYDKKIEDLKLNITKEQEAIDKLKSGIASPKSTKEEVASFKKQLADRIEIQKNFNETLIATNQTRDLELGVLQEKFLEKDLQKKNDAFQYQLKENQIRHNNELSSIKTLADAKKVLSNYLKEDEINKITSLEDAKKIIKEKHLLEDFNTQKKHLDDLAEIYKKLLAGETVEGFKILTDEEVEHIKKNAQEVALALSQMVTPGTTPEMGTRTEGMKALSGLDILGSSPEQWDAIFGNLSSAESKIAAVTTVVNGLQNAFGMYFQFVEAGEKRNLQKFEAATKKKKDALSDQLEKGIITQEVYNARNAKLDADLAKKKAELEYKQAKRQKAMQAAQIISSTALAIMGIWAQVPKFDFGISAGVLTGVVAGLGAAQLGLLLAQPLPDKNGFYDGGYTGSGNEKNSPGPVHYDEYVIPKKVLFSNDPVVPNIVGYLEAKRTGKQPLSSQDETTSSTSAQGGSGSAQNDSVSNALLKRAVVVLEKLEEDGVQSYLVNDYQTAKKMRDKIKEVTKNETNAKP